MAEVTRPRQCDGHAWLARLARERGESVARGLHGRGPAHRPLAALVLLRSFGLADLREFVQGTRAFTAGLAADEADNWYRSWTMTWFLFGDPRNLPAARPARAAAPSGSIAWLGPVDPAHPPGLARLLKPVAGVLPRFPPVVDIPSATAASHREIRLAVRGLDLARYLVHLHHTIAEAVLLRRLRPAEPIRLIHVADLDPASVQRGPAAYARVHRDLDDAARLRLYALLR
jgi:hypothetical protein